jgi:hypothetical protein
MQPGISRSDVRATSLKPFGVTGEALDFRGQQTISITIGGREFKHKFLVCSLPTEAAGLLGTDFMNDAGAKIDFECGKMSLTDIGRAPLVHTQLSTERAALIVFDQGKEGHSPQPYLRKARHTDVKFSARPHPESESNLARQD